MAVKLNENPVCDSPVANHTELQNHSYFASTAFSGTGWKKWLIGP